MRSLLFLLIACLSLVLLADVSKKFKLRSKLKEGSKFKFSVFMSMKAERNGEKSKKPEMEAEVKIDCNTSVKKSDEKKEEKVLENEVRRIRARKNEMGAEFEYDSDKDRRKGDEGEDSPAPVDENQRTAMFLRQVIGKKFRLKVTERLAMEMAESDAEFAGMSLPATTHLLPDFPVAVGDKWEAEAKFLLPPGEETKMKLILTLKSVDNGVAMVEGRFKKVKGTSEELDIEKSSFKLRFNIEGGYPEKIVMKFVLKKFEFIPAPPGGDGEGETSAELTVEYSMKPKTEEKETKEKKKDEKKPKTEPVEKEK